MKPKVSIIMGSTSDLPVMEKAASLFNEFEIPFEINALSAHRTPRELKNLRQHSLLVFEQSQIIQGHNLKFLL